MQGFKENFSYLEIIERIGYFAVFGGFADLASLHQYENLRDNIRYNILEEYTRLKPLFHFTNDLSLQHDLETLLFRIAVGDRKSHSIYKNDISQPRGRELYKILFEKKIITKEYSREVPRPKIPGRFLKKELRRYKIEDKILFDKNFTRFWFTFVTPYEKEIARGDFSSVLAHIDRELDKYISFTFENLSNLLIQQKFKDESITESGSYWDRDIELDLLAKTTSGKVIAGECKWKNQRISKNILNKLEKKCELVNLKIDYYALFSKSGFSNELLKHRPDNLLLFESRDFESLL